MITILLQKCLTIQKQKNLIKAAKKYEKKGKIEKAQKRYAKAQKLLLKSNDKKTITGRYFKLFRFYY
jgi:hypothetical protein